MLNNSSLRWAPFNALIDSKEVKEELSYKRNSIARPTLSPDQIEEFERIIIDAYKSNLPIEIQYYQNAHAKILIGRISKIDALKKKLSLTDGATIYFYNIINISYKST